MPDLKNIAFRFYLKHFFPPDFSAARSVRQQQRNFKTIMRSLSITAIARDLKLNGNISYSDFQNKVPVTQYDFYEAYVERIKQGEPCVMSAHKVLWFGKTAGTTSGKSKLIPITNPIIRGCHVRGTFFGLSRVHDADKTIDILNHKNFVMTGGVYEERGSGKIGVADISAIMMRHVPWPFRTIYAPDNALVTHASWEYKIGRIPAEVMDADVGCMIGVPTWHLTVLNKIHEQRPFAKLTEIWKNVRIFYHGGVNFEPYRKHFKELVGREDFIFFEIYNATEGFFGVQASLEGGDLLLLTDTGIFYEFIPFAEYGTNSARAVTLSEVEKNVPYVILITAINGLLRYAIGDVITFTGLDPFTFKITGRTQEYINAFGEDLLLSNVVNALTKTNEQFNCSVREYTVAPLYIQLEQKGRMQFLVEFILPPEDVAAYAKLLDEQLQKENSNYAQKRRGDLALSALELIVAPAGTFYSWMQARGKLGGQNKVPRLVNGRKVIEEILNLI